MQSVENNSWNAFCCSMLVYHYPKSPDYRYAIEVNRMKNSRIYSVIHSPSKSSDSYLSIWNLLWLIIWWWHHFNSYWRYMDEVVKKKQRNKKNHESNPNFCILFSWDWFILWRWGQISRRQIRKHNLKSDQINSINFRKIIAFD